MCFTRSQACAQVAEEAQAALLQAIHQAQASLPQPEEISTPLPTILEDVPFELPFEPVISRCASISAVVVPSVPSFICKKKPCLSPTSIQGLPIPGLKRR